MKICDRKINAIIFDLDGTLLDSTGIWHNIDIEFFGKRGMEIPATFAEDISHVGLKEAAVLTVNKYLHNEKPEENNVSLKMPSYIIIGSIIIVSVIIIAIVLIVSYIKFVRSMRMAERSNS